MKEVVAVVGLGYVGLPLAVAFGKRLRTIGYDRSRERSKPMVRRRLPKATASGRPT